MQRNAAKELRHWNPIVGNGMTRKGAGLVAPTMTNTATGQTLLESFALALIELKGVISQLMPGHSDIHL
jgi:hypothetical protein